MGIVISCISGTFPKITFALGFVRGGMTSLGEHTLSKLEETWVQLIIVMMLMILVTTA